MADPDDFDAFVTHGCRGLKRTAWLLTGDAGLAEDLLQTALTKAWRSWARIEGDPQPYVRRILVTTATTWRSRRWTGEIATGELPDAPAPATDDTVDLRAALLTLPPRQRACVVLRYVEDLTEAQTAEALDISVGTVKSTTHKALAALRQHPRVQLEEVAP